ncbi:hypothetical protein [Halomonas sp. I5-271120]|uniref:hypothetical protein n=1 Tax=Halomonas sp. I5-271120 TaxID=3061632 RepID=UPI002714F4D6|nr:hypothetical protein [Halomonas sp. I5-271120]
MSEHFLNGHQDGPMIRDASGKERPVELAAKALAHVYSLDERGVSIFLRKVSETLQKHDLTLDQLVEMLVRHKGSHVMSVRRLRTAERLRSFFHGEGARRYVCVNPYSGEAEIAVDTTKIIQKWERQYGAYEVDAWKVVID